ncbi:hypothetical protein JW960_26640 [candidate division KSB1 bacterium]|nr:hypothetical protein [candidate division KSB1 bacterium]
MLLNTIEYGAEGVLSLVQTFADSGKDELLDQEELDALFGNINKLADNLMIIGDGIDNDGNSGADEEILNGIDDDNDGLIDEDIKF